MGLTPDTVVTLIKKAPMGDPLEIFVRGYELTLRKEDAALIACEEAAAPKIGPASAPHRMIQHPHVGELETHRPGDKPLIPAAELEDITKQLLACGANIVEMNTLRKRLSAVKGGRFAQLCAPAKVFSVVLSDIIGDPLDMIASGPAYPDSSTCEQAQAIVKRDNLKLSPEAMAFLSQETPKSLDNVETQITGSVRQLCAAAEKVCRGLGYEPVVLTAELSCTARDAGSFLGAIARTHKDTEKSLAYIAGGETVVHLTGHGLGGRNQEIALAAAPLLDGVKDAAVFSVGSDGTDGPTDAAGGYCDGETMAALRANGIDVTAVLADNDAYHALKECGGLIITGPTGTNVNDLTVLLLRR